MTKIQTNQDKEVNYNSVTTLTKLLITQKVLNQIKQMTPHCIGKRMNNLIKQILITNFEKKTKKLFYFEFF